MIFLCLEPSPLNTNIKLSNNKTKAILLSRIKGPTARFWNCLLPDASITNSELVSTFSDRQCELLWKI